MQTMFDVPIVDAAELPTGFEALTIPISIDTESHIVRSICQSLCTTDALATVCDGKIQFWRRLKKPCYPDRIRAGVVRTR